MNSYFFFHAYVEMCIYKYTSVFEYIEIIWIVRKKENQSSENKNGKEKN